MNERPTGAGVIQVTATDLETMLERGAPLEFVDVRTPEERELARIEGARLLDDAFTQVYNLVGGIDAWSLSVDSSVPRY